VRVPAIYLYVSVVPAVLIALFLLWMLVSALLSFVGGWHTLGKLYPKRESAQASDLGSSSISLSRGIFVVNYNNSVKISVGQQGVGIETSSLFLGFHNPLFIPWAAIEECRRQKLLVREVTVQKVRGEHLDILVRGESGATLFEYWQKEVKK
jgi:hypothetical protein